MACKIRQEAVGDQAVVASILERAFGGDVEARLVASLRGQAGVISLVAVSEGEVRGHIMFSPVTIVGESERSQAIGLAPMAVDPDHQRCGIGSALVRAGLDQCLREGQPVVAVLGHRRYYPRFGFRAAGPGLYWKEPGPQPSFMVAELRPGALRGRTGRVEYLPEFEAFD